jgi:hypothetical protein
VNESKIALTERLRREGRWDAATKFKDDALRDFRSKGMRRDEASEAAWEAMEQAYPPIAAVAATADMQAEVATDTRIHGLSDIPASWGELPANASLHAEIAWCQANRLWVVEEKPNGATVVHLNLARTPAPSWSALGWLETSIRAFAKFVDVSARASSSGQDEADKAKRERLQIAEIRGLLEQMRAEA